MIAKEEEGDGKELPGGAACGDDPVAAGSSEERASATIARAEKSFQIRRVAGKMAR
jgi:hypothetical protein